MRRGSFDAAAAIHEAPFPLPRTAAPVNLANNAAKPSVILQTEAEIDKCSLKASPDGRDVHVPSETKELDKKLVRPRPG